jgi:hypothetical protein
MSLILFLPSTNIVQSFSTLYEKKIFKLLPHVSKMDRTKFFDDNRKPVFHRHYRRDQNITIFVIITISNPSSKTSGQQLSFLTSLITVTCNIVKNKLMFLIWRLMKSLCRLSRDRNRFQSFNLHYFSITNFLLTYVTKILRSQIFSSCVRF